MPEVIDFNSILGAMPDVTASADQILATHADATTGTEPFGTEFIIDTEAKGALIGNMACAVALQTKVDDSDTFAQDLQ